MDLNIKKMIQRVQSIYLLISLVLMLLFVLMPIGFLNIDNVLYEVKSWGVSSADGGEILKGIAPLGLLLLILSFISLAIIVFTTILFKRRLFQIKLGKLNILVHSAVVVLAFFYIDDLKSNFSGLFTWGAPIIFPLISMIFILMANRAIRRDDNLVRSADRLR